MGHLHLADVIEEVKCHALDHTARITIEMDPNLLTPVHPTHDTDLKGRQ